MSFENYGNPNNYDICNYSKCKLKKIMVLNLTTNEIGRYLLKLFK